MPSLVKRETMNAQRIALGLTYSGQQYEGWQSQLSQKTVQDQLEKALGTFAQTPIRTLCAGRTDAGVHALLQVVHFDAPVEREMSSWVRGTNRYLPSDIALQWAQAVSPLFHARQCATSRRYSYLLLQSPVRPSLEYQRVGWVAKPLSLEPMQEAAQHLLGTHDFSSFRAAQCQALSPVKTLLHLDIVRKSSNNTHAYFRFDFEANAFLHHMIRNIMGCLVEVGLGKQPPEWMSEVVLAKDRNQAAPTFSADGLYFLGPRYDARWGLPLGTPSYDWIL
jgi:tRNA pseudouridine38-40 synthase